MPEAKCGFEAAPDGTSGADLLVVYGPTLYVNIGFDSNWKPVAGAPNLGDATVEALVDTGATVSCIDDNLAKHLKLPVIDQRPLGGVCGELMATMYLAQIYVPSLDRTIYGDFAGVQNFAVVGVLPSATLAWLICMDYLSNNFKYS